MCKGTKQVPVCRLTGWEEMEPIHAGDCCTNHPWEKGLATSSGGSYMKTFPQMLLSLRWPLLCWTSARFTASEGFHVYDRLTCFVFLKNVSTGVFNGFSKTYSIKNFMEQSTTKVIRISGQIEGKSVCEAASVWHCNVRSWLRLEFGFYRLMNDLGQFCDTWTIWIYFVLSLLTCCILHSSSRSDGTATFIYYFKRCFCVPVKL